MFDRTTWYFNDITKYRKGMRAIQAEADEALKRLEQYKGSAGYQKDAEAVEEKRLTAVKALQAEVLSSVSETIDGMRKKAKARQIQPPTAEQESILRLLKMRKTITRNELDQAANSLQDCPLALSVLREIAQDHEILGFHNSGGRASTEEILSSIDALERFARTSCEMPRIDNREEWIKSPLYHADVTRQRLDFFRVDKDLATEDDLLTFAGDVRNLSDFRDAVNG